jgi:hypothetical protein
VSSHAPQFLCSVAGSLRYASADSEAFAAILTPMPVHLVRDCGAAQADGYYHLGCGAEARSVGR